MKYFALCALLYSLNIVASDMPVQNKQNSPICFNVRVENSSQETVTCWLSSYQNYSFVPTQRLQIAPHSKIYLTVNPGVDIHLSHTVNNIPISFADFKLNSEHKRILITPRFSVQKELHNGMWT